MVRLVTISGLSYTGTTSLGINLAEHLKWEFISAGNRFRDYCSVEGINITSIPLHIQIKFDKKIIEEIAKCERVVFEGRYLGYLARNYAYVLKMLIEADAQVRIQRCLQREDKINSVKEASDYINGRDKKENSDAIKLYKIDDIMNKNRFNMVMINNNEIDCSHVVKTIVENV